MNTHTVAELARYFHAVLHAAQEGSRVADGRAVDGREVQGEFFPDYNIAPRKRAAMVRLGGSGEARELEEAQWGLMPSWAKDPQFGSKTFNARSETVAEKPTFRSSFRKRRCLIPASGYYEWQKIGTNKQPWYLHPSEVDKPHEPFGFAGLWEPGTGSEGGKVDAGDKSDKSDVGDASGGGTSSEGDTGGGGTGAAGGPGSLSTFTILTAAAPENLADIHARVPVVVAQDLYDDWLDVTNPAEAILQVVLQRNPVGSFVRRSVGKAVGNVRNNGPELLKEVSQI